MKDEVTENGITGSRVKLFGGLGAVGVLLLFLLQNLQDAEINFLWFEWNIPVIWALLASAACGAIAALGFSTLRGRRAKAYFTRATIATSPRACACAASLLGLASVRTLHAQ